MYSVAISDKMAVWHNKTLPESDICIGFGLIYIAKEHFTVNNVTLQAKVIYFDLIYFAKQKFAMIYVTL